MNMLKEARSQAEIQLRESNGQKMQLEAELEHLHSQVAQMDKLQQRVVELEEHNKELEAILAAHDKSVPAEPSAAAPVKADSLSDDTLTQDFFLALYDELDGEETGFCPRLDLRNALVKLGERNSKVTELANIIHELDMMIMDRDQFEGIVEAWVIKVGLMKL